MWCPENATVATITELCKSELFLCLSYLEDNELLEASTACVWFREAFFALTKNGGSLLLKIANNNRDCIFLSLEFIGIRERGVEELHNINFEYQFPRLVKLGLEFTETNISLFPKIRSVTQLSCWNSSICLNNSEESNQTSIGDIFPNLEVLILNGKSRFIVSKVKLEKLERVLVLRSSEIVGDLVLPGLRELVVSRSSFPEILWDRATGLQSLWLGVPDILPLNPISCLIQLETNN